MSADLYADLLWLPNPPEDFVVRCNAATETHAEQGNRIRELASFALNENQLHRLSKIIVAARDKGLSLAPLTPFRLGVVSNATSHFIVPALIATAARFGIFLECVEADLDQAIQEALSPDSRINRSQPDAVLVALDQHGLPFSMLNEPDMSRDGVAAALSHLDIIRSNLKANSKAVVILQTVPRQVETLFGSLDLLVSGTYRKSVDLFNRALADSLSDREVLLDIAGLAETVGLEKWHDPTLWNMAKLPFAHRLLPLYADHVCRIIAALRGKSRRCLILDLDNTVWGGVIGDDGVDGIVVGQGDPVGEAHLAVQQMALALRARGIVLAVSSKNHDEIARLPFQKHPEMLLREDHIAVFQANWSDKATNITAIADALSLGLDTMVFLDDNPAERALVRRMLPQVAVPELQSDPALYARTLAAGGYFEALVFTNEDRRRAALYQENARRGALQKQVGDLDAYLASLNMVMTLQPFDDAGRNRIAQLINKSNQFNLTTRRYTEADVAEIQRDPDCFSLQIRLADNFGDNGMISVVICRRHSEVWEVDTWLMSCRVLGRKVENAILRELATQARRLRISTIMGTYLPTERNKLVEDHYAKLGFTLVDRLADGTTRWKLDVASIPSERLPMEVRYAEPAVG